MRTKQTRTTRDEVRIADLTPDPHNRRTHTPRNLGMLVDALQEVGAARSIVIDEQNEVLAGNGVVEAAAEAGITKVQVVDADGETIIAVRRRGLTPDQKRKLSLYDNRVAELSEWNADQLKADRDAGLDLATFFTDHEQAKMFGKLGGADDTSALTLAESYQVLVRCADETSQAKLLERLTGEGFECRALMS